MPQLAVYGPFRERDLHDDFGLDPMGSDLRQPYGLGERRGRLLDPIEPLTQVEEQGVVEAGSDLAGEDEVVRFEIPDEQRAEADARALRIGEPADDQFLRRLALHFEPVLRTAMFVGRST